MTEDEKPLIRPMKVGGTYRVHEIEEIQVFPGEAFGKVLLTVKDLLSSKPGVVPGEMIQSTVWLHASFQHGNPWPELQPGNTFTLGSWFLRGKYWFQSTWWVDDAAARSKVAMLLEAEERWTVPSYNEIISLMGYTPGLVSFCSPAYVEAIRKIVCGQ